MENPASEPPQQSCEDVRKSGYLRKQKSMHRRYFVLRTASERGAARLEYYESEKKFRGKAPIPKKALVLETCFNINKRADSKNKYMIVLYTRAESFAIAAENEADQDEWYQAMVDLQCKSKSLADITSSEAAVSAAAAAAAASGGGGDYGDTAVLLNPGPAFKEVWQVKVWPKGLGQAKNLVGIYRLCLTDKTVNFVKLHSDAAAVVLQLMNVRRCGHSENFFFVEVGRSAVTGPGEFWMQVDDSVVAQNMHESLLEAMKALSDEFRQRSKSQSSSGPGGGATASNPISVPSRRHHPNPPPSQVGFTRRSRTEPPIGGGGGGGAGSGNASPTPRHGLPRPRTASDAAKGEEGATGGCSGPQGPPGSSPATNGSCSGTPVLRSKSARSSSAPATKAPLGLMRSISTPAPSPAPSLSSSSGHGSEFGGAGAPAPGQASGATSGPYGRGPPSHHASVSGSPSDYGSSDEYGSSPGEHGPLASPGLGPGSLDDAGSNYILMGQCGARGGGGGGATDCSSAASSLASQDGGVGSPQAPPQTKRVLRRSSSRECEAERQLLSKRASLPPMALERLAPRGGQRRGEGPSTPAPGPEEDCADYAVMSRSTSRESFASSASSSCTQRDSGVVSGSSAGGGGGYLDVAGGAELYRGGGEGGVAMPASPHPTPGVDNGYMSMLPGGGSQPPPPPGGPLAASFPDGELSAKGPADDYMAMTPNNSVSPPQPIRPPPHAADGYMMMSPHGSCSPDQRGGGAWPGSADSRAGSDYMNMSPISARSANGSPPPAPEAEPQHAASAQQGPPQPPGPKMVYSYYSLPRSYKHNPSKGLFEEGVARGRRPNGGAGGSSSRGAGGGGGPAATGNGRPELAAAGRHLSLSSSSYSSSSASNESLVGEGEERAPKGPHSAPGGKLNGGGGGGSGGSGGGGGGLQQRRGGAAPAKQGGHARSRPVSLFVDVSKANTLPRVRENPLAPEPKSPGEYVSIEFKGLDKSAAAAGGLRHGYCGPPQPGRLRPACGFLPLSRSPSAPLTPPPPPGPGASEYVNMDLGPSPCPSPLSLTPLGFPSFHTPPTPPTLAPQAPKLRGRVPGGPCREEEDEEVVVVVATGGGGGGAARRKSRESVPAVGESESPTSCGDYTEMAFSLNRDSSAPTRMSSSNVSPKAPSPARPTDPLVPGLPLGLDFPPAKPLANPDHGAKVIRADPQGRRRHCSETFLASGPAPSSSSTASTSSSSSSSSSTASLFPEHAQAVARRLGFEGMLWGNSNGGGGGGGGVGGSSDSPAQFHLPGQQPSPIAQALCAEQGLNYIDLDLANKEMPHPVADGPSGLQAAPSRLFALLGGGSVSGSGGGAGGGGGGAGAGGSGSGGVGGSSLNTYASIDFYKSDELRSHQNGSKEGTEC